jgi:hypothetical protein
MALKACRECGQQVSTEAASCPHCGVPKPSASGNVGPIRQPESKAHTPYSRGGGCLVGLGLLLVFGLVAQLTETKSGTSRTGPGDKREVASLSGPPHGFRSYEWGAPPGSDLKRRGDPTDEGLSIYTLSSSKPAPTSRHIRCRGGVLLLEGQVLQRQRLVGR